MRKFIVALLFLALAIPSDSAVAPQTGVAAKPGTASSDPGAPGTTSAQPAKRESLINRLFGPRPTPPPPAPVPTPTPAPKRKIRRPSRATPAPRTAPVAKPRDKKAEPAGKLDLSGMDDATKFQAVKKKAMEDPELKDLKSKADSEVDETEAGKALAAYNRALFRKIREIEPSLGDYSEKVEASMTRRLSAEKGRP